MAVAPMTKAQVVIHGAASAEVVQQIYELGIIQAIEVVEAIEHAEQIPVSIGELESHLREVTRSLEILSLYDNAKREVVENFITLKHRLPRSKFATVRQNFDFLGRSRQIAELTEKLKHLEDQEGWRQDDIELLSTLSHLPFPLEDLRSTRRVKTLVGRIRREEREALAHDLAEDEESVFWEEISDDGQFVYLLVLYYPSERDVHALLERHGFDILDLSKYSRKIPEEIQRLTQEREQLQRQIAEVKETLTQFVQDKEAFRIIEDALVNEIRQQKDLQNFARTPKVYFLEGWMKQADKTRLEHGLRDYTDSIDILYEDPAEDDEAVPVILENTPYIQPFEIITRMYGMPKYHEPDPTPMLAPFFFLFFGLCLTDAGYGILLSLFMVWLMRKYVLDAGTTQLARLLYYGGFSTLVCGAFTGGWFGNIIDSLPAALTSVKTIKDALIIIDPMQEPIAFLILSLVLGYIQVCYGIFLKMRHRWRQGDPNGALLDQGIWLAFINSLFFWVILLASGMGDSLIGQGLSNLFMGLALLSGAARVWLHDRGNSKLVMRILAGLYSLYDIVGIFSDVLSYSRLLALGLATGVIAMIIDMLTLMTTGIPGIGFLVGIIIFVFGHIFNLVINTLGSFIHSGRLQFVEFFSKFFEAGGKKYKPFKFESRYFELTE
ncbi:H(+)-transporting two-sector ATPase [Candidatus Vecturithrix granuli]|uniref:H(+)-transporting two-sector ATPase n=1 Tax=Vecturithrix granuli TaxID=1499967 RepID=A0A081C5M2_VECG1|nr:H(+)-transporting two-sector ATPase [Candidatus Vecturithrix granuli]